MKLISAVTAILLATTSYASAANVTIDPVGFALLDLGTGAADSHQTSSSVSSGGINFAFVGGSPVSGEYAGSPTGAASPFGNSTTNYVMAGGVGGVVNVTWDVAQTELRMLWGSVDTEPGRNLITIGSTLIDGADIFAASVTQGFGVPGNAFVTITGLPSFTSATFSDAAGTGFEFALAPSVSVPGPIAGAGLPGLIIACGGMLGWMRKRRQST